MFNKVETVSKKANKPKLLIFADMVLCGFKYGAGYVDYDVIGFYKLSPKQRKTMLTRGKNDKIVKKLNNKKYWHLFNNKNEFNLFFARFIGRDWVIINKDNITKNLFKNEEFIKFKHFIRKHPVFFAKPNDGQCGKGIQKVSLDNLNKYFKDNGINYQRYSDLVKSYSIDSNEEDLEIKCLFKSLIDNKLYLNEEPINQHHVMNKLNPSCVNTIRLVTIMNKKKEVTILASFVRIGNGVNVVDNFNSGGMTARVSLETGKIIEAAINKEGKIFEKHPTTNEKIEGFQIPFFEEAKNMVKEAATLSENVRYVGWDVAITENGPTLVEGNQFPGHDIYQVAEKLDENSVGVWPEFKKALK